MFHPVILDMFMKLSKDTMVALYIESAIQFMKYKKLKPRHTADKELYF